MYIKLTPFKNAFRYKHFLEELQLVFIFANAVRLVKLEAISAERVLARVPFLRFLLQCAYPYNPLHV